MLECPNCQTNVQPSDRFCEACGTALTTISTALSCTKCGATNAIDADGYCEQCGFRIEPDGNSSSKIDRIELVISPVLAGVSDRGFVHFRNEDAIALQSIHETQILVVCDGVSSSLNPHLASQTAAQTICQALVEAVRSEIDLVNAMQTAIAQAQTAVSALSPVTHADLPSSLDLDAPSTTGVAAIVQAGMATIGWLGDSRAYWVSAADQTAHQLTQDDSWITDQVRSGRLSLTEAQQNPHAHAITRWLGADATDFIPSIVTVPLKSPGYLILCSDGLWNYLSDPDHLFELVSSLVASIPKTSTDSVPNTVADLNAQDALSIAWQLMEYARSQGGHDNVTVAVLAVVDSSGVL